MRHTLALAATAALLSLAPAHAQPVAPPAAGAAPTLRLQAEAHESVALDEMVVVLATDREGPSVGTLNAAVLKELNAALSEAKLVQGVEVRMGAMNTQQSWDAKGRPNGWRVRGDIVLESRKLKELGDLTGRLSEKLQISGVSFQLSRERRQEVETRLIDRAAEAFSSKARAASKALGFKGYAVQDLSLDQPFTPTPSPVGRPMMALSKAAGMESVAPEGGKTDVQVTFNGTVTLKP